MQGVAPIRRRTSIENSCQATGLTAAGACAILGHGRSIEMKPIERHVRRPSALLERTPSKLANRPHIRWISADQVSVVDRAEVLNAAYADYYIPLHMTPAQLSLMDLFYDINLICSGVAYEGEISVGTALLGVRGDRGWVTGLGVIPEWRRRGIGRVMMDEVLRSASASGVKRVWLEVINKNRPARRLYDDLGFKPERELLTWHRSADSDPLPIPVERLVQAAPEDLVNDFAEWQDLRPCWQRERSSLMKMTDRLKGYRLDWRSRPAAYCLVSESPEGVAVMDVGIGPGQGLLVPGRVLLQALVAEYARQDLTMVNVSEDDSLNRVLAALHFSVVIRQTEMSLLLDR